MARGDAGQTRDEIKRVALGLFAIHGCRGTSLRAIAERLGITKAALYYHFPSKEELVVELFQPLLDDAEALLASLPETEVTPARPVFERVFDMLHRHRKLFTLFLRDSGAYEIVDVIARLMDWREGLSARLLGPDATSADMARATVALGGLLDSATQVAELADDGYREAAIDAAVRAFTVKE